MAYVLNAAIAATDLLRAATSSLPHARLVPLDQGLSFMPISDDLFDAVTERSAAPLPGFWRLPAGFERTLADWSRSGPVAYVEAEYFGGTGEQHAAAWHQGHLIFGPLHIEEGQRWPEGGSPISQALRHLGAQAGTAFDEFDAVGLQHHRHT
ncbi:hypothetical protein [Spirillospora sp. NPDC047279]|uniref:hypothetical protein n=1 Tax=Spirillospora sp. NPDC047279 TaxID=3155478 RepID=UPI003403F131